MNNDLREVLVEVKGLKRCFGKLKAVDGVSFTIQKGRVVGLIGANGAGKTTMMRLLATLDVPDAGQIFINGIDLCEYPEKVRPRIGWMPDYFMPYSTTTIWEYLDFFARAYGCTGDSLVQVVNEVMDFTDLTELKDRFMDKLSKGQNQRLCLARTLINDPDFLILDEPAAGLDPKARLEFKNLVRILQERGKTILISSHILSELGEMCDTFLFMDNGQLMLEGGKDVLLESHGKTSWKMEILADMPPADLKDALALRPGWKVVDINKDGVVAEFAANDQSALREELKQLTVLLPIYEFHRQEQRLEDAFVNLLKKEDNSSKTNSPQQ